MIELESDLGFGARTCPAQVIAEIANELGNLTLNQKC